MGKIYDKASIIVPQGAAYEATKIYAAKPLTDDASMEYIRSSAATRITDCGEIKEVPANVPQYDYIDGESWLRLEKESTNIIPYYIVGTGWSSSVGCTVTTEYAVSLEGKINASRIQSANSNDYVLESCSVTSGQVYTYSIYAKGESGKQIRLYADGSGSANTEFTLDGSWQRFSVNITATSTGSLNAHVLMGYGSSNPARDFLLWGAQVEQGYIPTSLIRTTGSTATRYQSFYHNDDFKSGYEFKTTGWSYATKIKWDAELGNGGNVKRFADFNYTQVWYLLEPYNNGTAYVSLNPVGTVLASEVNFDKFIVYRYNGTKLFVYNDGNLLASGTTAQTNDFVNKDRYGDSGFVGHIGDELYFNQCLSEDEAIELSLK